ncbi:transposase [Streptomyces phaeochromogenes]|nr:transposase [Streptomyces phaeochromogenes]
MAPRSKVELYAAIRRDCRAGLSKRAVMRKYGVGHPTVQNALESTWPKPRKKPPPRVTRLDPYKPLIDQMLRTDLDAPRKQRHTAKRIFDRLQEEHHASGISYGMVRDYVAVRRGEIRAMAGRGPVEAFVPQSHRPGVEAEVDFGDVTVRLAGQTVTCYLFSFRLSYSGKAVHRIFASGGQEAFFEGHVPALSVLGGAPTGKVRYDNLKAAVSKVIGFTRERRENERWIIFREHYGLDSFYCRPGLAGVHEKGATIPPLNAAGRSPPESSREHARHLVKDRLDITGACWGLPGAEAVLKLRAVPANGDFDTYWAWHQQQEFIRNHQTRCRDQVIPTA